MQKFSLSLENFIIPQKVPKLEDSLQDSFQYLYIVDSYIMVMLLQKIRRWDGNIEIDIQENGTEWIKVINGSWFLSSDFFGKALILSRVMIS